MRRVHMSRINDYVIGEEEAGRREVVDSPEPQIPPPVEITIDSGVPIPKDLIDRSDLNNRFGKLPFHIMTEGQSFALDNLTDKEFVALRARVSRANKNTEGRFALKQEDKTEYGIRGRVYRVQ